MIELKTKTGKRILVNADQICVVQEEANGAYCAIYMLDADSWYVKGSLDEIAQRIWEEKKFN